jgi:Tat protein translocase TatB subunit
MLNPAELMVIFVVALLVVGPKKLPEVARTLGKGLADLKRAFDDVKGQVQTEFNEIKDTSGIKEALTSGVELKQSLQDMTEQVKSDFKKTVDISVTEPVNDLTKNVMETIEQKEKTDKPS